MSVEPSKQDLYDAGRLLASSTSVSHDVPSGDTALKALPDLLDWIERMERMFANAGGREADWFLDNAYLLKRWARHLRNDLTIAAYRRLPAVVDGSHVPVARVEIIARALIVETGDLLGEDEITAFLKGYQQERELFLRELWVLPAVLSFAVFDLLMSKCAMLLDLDASDRKAALWPPRTEDFGKIAFGTLFRTIQSLERLEWLVIVQATSHVHRTLSLDPSDVFSNMDEDTQSSYASAVERLAAGSTLEERAVAEAAVELSAETGKGGRGRHVGFWLIGDGADHLRQKIEGTGPARFRLKEVPRRHPGLFYALAIAISVAIGLLVPTLYLSMTATKTWHWVFGLGLTLLPATVLGVTIVHWLITKTVRPERLPSLDPSTALGVETRTAVAMPVIIGATSEIPGILRSIEVRHAGNGDLNIVHVLLSDVCDASSERTQGDVEIEEALKEGIAALNARTPNAPFVLLHRRRRWSETETCWMGWERKRGKLTNFNALLSNGERSVFPVRAGSINLLRDVRYVVTVDADTVLPPQSVANLVATMAHPLNRPIIDDQSMRVTNGHALMQPRVDTLAATGGDDINDSGSWFSRLFAGDGAIDIYSRAVSDAYQDLFGIGIYCGKGIYDVRAFQRVLDGRVPEGAMLSHDLFEGLFARAALATHIVVYEDYPSTLLDHAARQHRWVRGDWQLLPWLVGNVPHDSSKTTSNPLNILDRWLIVDNLRRSLIPPALLLLFTAGWMILPGSAWVWTSLALLAPTIYAIDHVWGLVTGGPRRGFVSATVQKLAFDGGRWFLSIAFLVHDTMVNLDAIGHALWRTYVSRRRLLEWHSAAHTRFGRSRRETWAQMWPSAAFAMVLTVNLALFNTAALLPALPALLLWMLAPEIAYMLARPRPFQREKLSAADRRYLLTIGRRTWHYFESFVGPKNNWLPPDNYQRDGIDHVAHRTSPTNIGLYLTSALAAHDMGFITTTDLAIRVSNTFDTLDRMERFQGHWLNWYDTRSLMPLEPRYVSSVDSGNMAISFLALAEGLQTIHSGAPRRSASCDGLRATLDCLVDALGDEQADVTSLLQTLDADVSAATKLDLPSLAQNLATLRTRILARPHHVVSNEALVWLERFEHDLNAARRHEEGDTLIPDEGLDLSVLAQRARNAADEMNFRSLYDERRKLLRIGYNLSAGHHDANHYDLLASEARLASFFAIAKGDVPVRHWFAMSRPVTLLKGRVALLSWNGSAFEYLMPPLFLPSRRDTLLGESEATAIEHQRRVGAAELRPWGTSESAFAATDARGNYQYRAFGDADLGLRRDLSTQTVVAPYATALALNAWPHAAVDNMRHLERCGTLSEYGFVEALDYTASRVPAGRDFAKVGTFMAHHQGMTVTAIANALFNDVMVERTMRDVRLSAIGHILHEHVPWDAEFEEPSETLAIQTSRPVVEHELSSWDVDLAGAPSVQALGNGTMTSLVMPDGLGRLSWNGVDFTRWAPYAPQAMAASIPPFEIRDRKSGRHWSLRDANVERRSVFRADRVELTGRKDGLALHTEIAVSPHMDVEVRKYGIVNETDRPRELTFICASQVALAPGADDERHPAFSKMFVRSEHLASHQALLFTRKARKPDEKTVAAVQRFCGAGSTARWDRFETDRETFLGRHGTERKFDCGQGFTLDPVSAIRLRIDLDPFAKCEFAVVTSMAASPEAALALTEPFQGAPFDWVFLEAEHDAGRVTVEEGLAPEDMLVCQRLATALTLPGRVANSQDPTLVQDDLWAFGISGDLPIIIVVAAADTLEVASISRLLAMHRHLARTGVSFDLVFLEDSGESYADPVRTNVLDVLREAGSLDRIGLCGGVHIVAGDRMSHDEAAAFRATAVLSIERHQDFEQALTTLDLPRNSNAAFEPAAFLSRESEEVIRDDKHFKNAWGGIEPGSNDYIIDGARPTPAPWCNITANDTLGAITSESGLGYTWAGNSGEFKLTPWSNDPVLDGQGEALWLRDESSGAVWTVTPLPAGAPCLTRHGAGFTTWTRTSSGLLQEQTTFVPPDGLCKVVRLTLHNDVEVRRRLTLTYSTVWVLGATATQARPHTRSHFDFDIQAIKARNTWNREFADQTAFLACDAPVHDYCCHAGAIDPRANGVPDGLTSWGLGRDGSDRRDPAGLIQVHVELAPGESRQVSFFLGCSDSSEQIADTLEGLRADGAVDAAWEETVAWWCQKTTAVQVETPDPAFDTMVNRWLPVQNLASRLLARAGFYQAGGAYGFRDQLQDCLAILMSDPQRARAHILRAARHQFEDGDALHWWHPPGGKGVRTRISDDYLWLPYVTARYVDATGHKDVLDEPVPFLSGDPLGDHEHDRYAQFAKGRTGVLYDHCAQAMARMQTTGRHGLPLIGTGDWNDGMDRVGDEGRGESVWLAWFQIAVTDLFVPLAEQRRDDRVPSWIDHAKRLREATEAAWDGEWYRRAYDDEGDPLGSLGAASCAIDSISQSWSVLAAGENIVRQQQAMNAVRHRLVDEKHRLVKLLDPPFGGDGKDPGYIASYPPGIRENGGQYTHAAAWFALATARMGHVDEAIATFDLLNPLKRTDIATYRREPYVLCADIGGADPFIGRGGWSWYTGAAGWAWQVAVHGILGVDMRGGDIIVRPDLPSDWPNATVTVNGPAGALRIVLERSNDGQPALEHRFVLPTDGTTKTECVSYDPTAA